MAVPAIVPVAAAGIRYTLPVVRSFASYLGKAEPSKLKRMYQVIKDNPFTAGMFAGTGIQGVLEAADSGNGDVLDVLVQAAEAGGFNLSSSVSNMFTDGEIMSVKADEANKALALKALANFLKAEVSSNPAYVLKYHGMMNEFLKMDKESVENLIKAYF